MINSTAGVPAVRRGVTVPAWDAEFARWDELDADVPREEFSEEEVVRLHWLLLEKVEALSDRNAPLAEKFDLMRWIFTDPAHDAKPFSFVSCLKVAGCSPLSHLPFVGKTDADEIRQWISRQLPKWLGESLSQYPLWVSEAVRSNPTWVAERLDANPQWINEQIRNRDATGDLFA